MNANPAGQVPRWLLKAFSILFLTVAAAAYLLTTGGDVYYAATSTVTTVGVWWMAGLSVVNALLLLGFTLYSGLGWRKRTLSGAIQALFWLAVASAYMAWTAWNGLGFIGEQTLGKVALQEARFKQAKDIADLTNAETLRERREARAWLERTYRTARTRAEKNQVLGEIGKAADAPIELKAPGIDSAMASGRATMATRIASRLGFKGVSEEDATVAWAAMAYILILFGKLVAPSIGIATWPRTPDPATVAALTGSVPAVPPVEVRRPWWARFLGQGAKPAGGEPDAIPEPSPGDPLPQPMRPVDLDRTRDTTLIQRWLEAEVVMAEPSVKVPADTVYQSFARWCQRVHRNGRCMTQTRFGRLMGDMDMPKERDGRRVVYRGLALKSEASAVLAA